MKNQIRIYALLILFVDAAMGVAFAGTISGTVTDQSTGQPISGLDFNLYDPNWTYIPINAVSDSGNYTFYNIEPGRYYIKANPAYPLHYRPQYWDASYDRAGAIPVVVAEGEDVTGINFLMTPGYYISGKIEDINSISIDGIDVDVYDTSWNKMDVDGESDEFGRYHIGGLPEGQYYVKANPIYPQPYVDQYWDHASGPLGADLVMITAPDDTIGISFNLDFGNYIEGDVLDSVSQQPVVDINMKAYNSDGEKMRVEARTRNDGHYILGAYVPGDYFVRADPTYPQGYMDMYYPEAFSFSSASPVTVVAESPSVDIDMNLWAGSYIRGSVAASEPTPIPDIRIRFYDQAMVLYEMAGTSTNSSGNFLSGALRPGLYYVRAVPVYPQPFIGEYYENASEPEGAMPINVVLGSEVTGIQFTLESGGYLLGTVTDAQTGDPIRNMDLDIYNDRWQLLSFNASTDRLGEFIVGPVPYRSYYVRCDPTLSQGFIQQYYSLAFWRTDAQLLNLISPMIEIADIDFALEIGGQISGIITSESSGIPIENIPMEVYSLAWNELPIHQISSNIDGTYTAFGIPAGEYYIRAAAPSSSGYVSEYYDNASSHEQAISVHVTAGGITSGIDFVLSLNGTPTPAPTATPTQPACLHRGDVIPNGTITAGDAQRAFEIALSVYIPSYTEACEADCNANGTVTAGDAQGIFSAALQLGTCTDPMVFLY